MWYRRNGNPVPDDCPVMPLDDDTGAIEIEGRREKVYTAEELRRLDLKRDRARKRAKKKAEYIAQFINDPRHEAFMDKYAGLILEAKRQNSAGAYNRIIVECLAKFNRFGFLTEDEIEELRTQVVHQEAPLEPQVIPVRLEPAPEQTQIVNTWIGRVGQTIEVRVKVVHAVGIRRWWRQQHVTVMEDTHGNTLVTTGRFLGNRGTELVITGTVSNHNEDSQTIIRRVKARKH